jgi:hypothetical protein
VRLLQAVLDGYEDDALYARGSGSRNLIKRPTARASGLPEEFGYGRAVLLDKLSTVQPRLAIFMYKRVTQELFLRYVDRPGPRRRPANRRLSDAGAVRT